MADAYSWRDVRQTSPSRLPGPDHLGWWVVISLLLAIVLHVVAFFALGKIKIGLGFQAAEEMRTAPIRLDRVEILPPEMDAIVPDAIPEPPQDAASLLEEIDILAQLPEDTEIDITPDTTDPEFAVKPQQPALEGELTAIDLDSAADFDLDTELAGMGRTESPLPLAAAGQVIVDPGAVEIKDPTLDDFTEEILKKGAGGNAAEGSLDGMVTLDDLVGLPENVLVGKKTLLPSDLIFEYNSADLRESARVGLMKLALLVERNPGLYCWIEGHTDLFGGDAYNLDLSQKRAAAVKSYLVDSLMLPAEKIVTRGFGKSQPIIASGTVDEQAPNRRVEIRMRRTLPAEGAPAIIAPPKPTPLAPKPEPPKAVLVKPAPDLPVQVVPPAPRAQVIPELPDPPKARPVEEETPRALPVEEEPPRAVPVGD